MFISWYRRGLIIPLLTRGQRVFLDFAGVMIAAQVFINGQAVAAEHKGGFTPFSLDITDFIVPDKENWVAVRVDSTERNDIPPFGGLVDYLTFGGIYRDVQLRITEAVYLESLMTRTFDVLEASKGLEVTAKIVNTNAANISMTLTARLLDKDKILATQSINTALVANQQSMVQIKLEQLLGLLVWDIASPVLYSLEVILGNADTIGTKIGFRTAEFREDGAFYLNNRALKLRGLNRHQSFPYIGMAAPARLQRKDAEILKFDLGCNIVRTSHYPQSTVFLDHCDQIGLLVLEEISGWQHIGDAAWKAVSLEELSSMITRDQNHPSIILWGVRINESPDDHDFYSQTNQLAHQLDPTRPTGGIRCFHGSQLLEDVYTMNDFQFDLGEPDAKKYLVTEYAGHMYPTKTFDQEDRVIKHALHHAHVLNQIYAMPVAGGIGWCAFDYNTHAAFGSGDRICYHGVMDIFRHPKLMASLYTSQLEPSERLVLEPITYWTRGDTDEGRISPLWIFSNLERVDVVVNGVLLGSARRSQRFLHLLHPPLIMDYIPGGWGEMFGDLELIGYLNNEEVARKKIASDGVPTQFKVQLDDLVLEANGGDMTRLSLTLTDDYDNIQPFAMQAVQLQITGPAEIIGPNPVVLIGGRVAVFIKSTTTSGKVLIKATTPRFQTVEVTLNCISVNASREPELVMPREPELVTPREPELVMPREPELVT